MSELQPMNPMKFVVLNVVSVLALTRKDQVLSCRPVDESAQRQQRSAPSGCLRWTSLGQPDSLGSQSAQRIQEKMRTILYLVTFVALSVQAAERPNIVFIFIDDQGYYDLGCYGAGEIKTPRIDAMAKAGTRFTDYYAAAPHVQVY